MAKRRNSALKKTFKPFVEFWEKPYTQKDPIEKIGTAVIFGTFIFILYKNGKNIIQWIKEQKAISEAKNELEALEKAGITPTYIESQYKIFGDTLWNALNSTWYNPLTWGTREETVRGVFSKMNNEADVNKLIIAFGLKEGLNLAESLHDDMSYDAINEYVNAPLQAKGINITF
jgi:hypothetical protein